MLQGETHKHPSILKVLHDVSREHTKSAKAASSSETDILSYRRKADLSFHTAIQKSFNEPQKVKILKGARQGEETDNPFSITIPIKRKYGDLSFLIRHYAANVVYDVTAWVDKNRDLLSREQLSCINSSRYQGKRSFFRTFTDTRNSNAQQSTLAASYCM